MKSRANAMGRERKVKESAEFTRSKSCGRSHGVKFVLGADTLRPRLKREERKQKLQQEESFFFRDTLIHFQSQRLEGVNSITCVKVSITFSFLCRLALSDIQLSVSRK